MMMRFEDHELHLDGLMYSMNADDDDDVLNF
jgi:hypothetical protein